MNAARFAKALGAVALFNALLYFAILPMRVAASDAADARKYTQVLKSGKTAKEKIFALQELGRLAATSRMFVDAALPDIYKALSDKDAGIRAAAATCLGQCDEPSEKTLPLLVKLLKDDKENSVKIGAAKGLASMGASAKSAVPALNVYAKDKKSPIRATAAMAVKAINGKK